MFKLLEELTGSTQIRDELVLDNICPVDPTLEPIIDVVNSEGVVIEVDVILDPVLPFVNINVVFG
jgi:hypothetical protein